MIRRNTWILLVLLAGLIAFTYYYNNRKALQAMDDLDDAQRGAAHGALQRGRGSSRRASGWQPPRPGPWSLAGMPRDNGCSSPRRTAEADQGLAEAAATQVSTLRVLDEIELGPSLIGLTQPAYVVTLSFTGGSTHSLEVGDKTPSEGGYYVHVDGARRSSSALRAWMP